MVSNETRNTCTTYGASRLWWHVCTCGVVVAKFEENGDSAASSMNPRHPRKKVGFESARARSRSPPFIENAGINGKAREEARAALVPREFLSLETYRSRDFPSRIADVTRRKRK